LNSAHKKGNRKFLLWRDNTYIGEEEEDGDETESSRSTKTPFFKPKLPSITERKASGPKIKLNLIRKSY